MKRFRMTTFTLLAAIPALTTGNAHATDDEIVAGLTPGQRPTDAPRISTFEKSAAWYRQALTGLTAPHPASLRFLEDQGAWHTPFTRPGMTGRYDIRNWHVPASAGGTDQSVERR